MSYTIKEERRKHNWTLEDVAQKVGITNQMVSYIENGKRQPSFKVLVKLEKLFNLSYEKLFEEI